MHVLRSALVFALICSPMGCERRMSRPPPEERPSVETEDETNWDAVVAQKAAESEARAEAEAASPPHRPPPSRPSRQATAPPPVEDPETPAPRTAAVEPAGSAAHWYREAGLRHTLFDPNDPAMTAQEGRYLKSAMMAMDAAAAVLLSHVPACLQGLCTTVPAERLLARIEAPIRQLQPPDSLHGHNLHLATALEHYGAACARWAQRGDGIQKSELRTDPDLRAARSSLDRARRQALAAFPTLGSQDRSSIADHHRALEVQ